MLSIDLNMILNFGSLHLNDLAQRGGGGGGRELIRDHRTNLLTRRKQLSAKLTEINFLKICKTNKAN